MNRPTSYVPGITVAYVPPSDARGPVWRATLTRGTGAANRWRVRVPYSAGPDAAAAAVVARFNETMGTEHGDTWRTFGAALSLDGGSVYAYAVGPAYSVATMRDTLDGAAPALPSV
jgi:hypothetical protein